MDDNKITYSAKFLHEVAKRRLLCLRFSPEWGRRGIKWEDEIIAREEIGVLSSSLGWLYSLLMPGCYILGLF